MKSIKYILILILINISFSQYRDTPDIVTKVATSASNWLKLETAARAVGMGGAQVAAGEGVSALAYNPASSGFMQSSQLYYSKTNYIADITHSSMAYGTQLTPTDFFAIHLFQMNSGDMEITTAEFPDGTGGFFDVTGLSFRGTYAKILTDRLKVGVSLKYIQESIYTTKMNTVAMDIGSNFDTGLFEDDQGNGIILGMAVSNLGPEAKYQGPGLDTDDGQAFTTDFFTHPMQFRLGGMKETVVGENHNFITSIDMITPIDYSLYGAIGMEYTWRDLVYARVGSKFGHDSSKLSMGGGFKLQANGFNVGLDYAFVDFGLLGTNHQFGINFTF